MKRAIIALLMLACAVDAMAQGPMFVRRRSAPPVSTAVPLDPRLIAWYKLDLSHTNTDGTFTDLSGNGNSLTNYGGVIGATYTTLDGTDDWMGTGTNISTLLRLPVAWTATNRLTRRTFMISMFPTAIDNDGILQVGYGATKFYSYAYTGNATYDEFLSAAIPTNAWYVHCLAATNNDSTGHTRYLYTNGVLSATNYFACGVTFASDPLWVGRYYFTGMYTFAGRISEVRVYNKTLSSSEQWTVYQEMKQ